MDKVRFGRALGYGARHAAKTMMQAVDAATTPDPRAAQKPPATSPASRPGARPSASPAASPLAEAVAHVQTAKVVADRTRQEAHKAGRSLLAPFKEFSRTIWLQVTGVFFALIAVSMVRGMVMRWPAVHTAPSSSEAQKFYLFAFFFVLFAYFTVSSFMRAARLGKTR